MTTTWNLEGFFPEFQGREHREHMEQLQQGLDELDSRARELGEMRQDTAAAWAELLLLDEKLMADFSHVAAYVTCLASADSSNEAYRAEQARIASLGARFTKAFAPVVAALRTVDDATFEALLARPELADAQYAMRRLRVEAGWSLPPEQEILSADLGVDGIQAWGRLYDDMSGRLTFTMPGALLGQGEQDVEVPMARKRALLEDGDPLVRTMALERSNKAWESMEHVAAAALNAIAGTRLSLYRHRGIEDFLTRPFFDARVRRESVEAMWQAVEDSQDTAQRIMRAKARCLGKGKLGFQDLVCPVPQAQGGRYSWEQACGLVLAACDARYPALGGFVREMLEAGRVESEERAGKRPGAFCTTSLLSRQSYVFMSFGGGLGDVQTLAHELGHAFHGRCLSDRRAFAARYPMTLAETASTFAERLLQDAILDSPDTDDRVKLGVLAARCNDAVTFMCDIRMRYRFEEAFYQERGQGEVPVSRIRELLLTEQKRSYGEGLDYSQLDPLFWASKLHFYITGVSFYNFPYTFGYLFSLSLAQQLQEQGAAFLPRYEELLAQTGSADCEEVVARALGQDITRPAFWRQALERIAQDAAQFEELAAKLS